MTTSSRSRSPPSQPPPTTGSCAESDFAEFSGLLSKITTPGKKASETLQALQVWMSEKGYRDNPRFQLAWKTTIDRLNVKA
jgi:hypothetical protein